MNGIVMVILNAVLVLGAVASGCVTIRAQRRRDAVLALAAVGAFLSVEFGLLRAPDAAAAEALAGTGVSTALFLLALRRVGEEARK